jgi:hypothetical protein
VALFYEATKAMRGAGQKKKGGVTRVGVEGGGKAMRGGVTRRGDDKGQGNEERGNE